MSAATRPRSSSPSSRAVSPAPGTPSILGGSSDDYKAELVVVIGRGGRDIDQADAWGHVGGLTVGPGHLRSGPAVRLAAPAFRSRQVPGHLWTDRSGRGLHGLLRRSR